jgi:hypothetical protein
VATVVGGLLFERGSDGLGVAVVEVEQEVVGVGRCDAERLACLGREGRRGRPRARPGTAATAACAADIKRPSLSRAGERVCATPGARDSVQLEPRNRFGQYRVDPEFGVVGLKAKHCSQE